MDIHNLPIPLSDGHWVSAKVNRTIEILQEYDHNLDVVWIPPDQREQGEAAFLVVEKTPLGIKPIFAVLDEEHMDERLLEQVFRYDTAKHKDVLSEMDARNQARRAMIRKEHQDQMEEAHDLAAHVLRSPKARYRHNGVVYE